MNIIRSITTDGSCVLTFDRAGSSANIFDHETLEELGSHLDALENESGIRGLILISAKSKIFIAGADLNALAKDASEAALADMKAAAKEMGADGVVGIDFDYEVLGETNGMMMVSVSGTSTRSCASLRYKSAASRASFNVVASASAPRTVAFHACACSGMASRCW